MEPAKSIIAKLGGPEAVSKATDMAITAPYRWMASVAKGGTDGRIPQKHWPALFKLARESGVELSVTDFFVEPTE